MYCWYLFIYYRNRQTNRNWHVGPVLTLLALDKNIHTAKHGHRISHTIIFYILHIFNTPYPIPHCIGGIQDSVHDSPFICPVTTTDSEEWIQHNNSQATAGNCHPLLSLIKESLSIFFCFPGFPGRVVDSGKMKVKQSRTELGHAQRETSLFSWTFK